MLALGCQERGGGPPDSTATGASERKSWEPFNKMWAAVQKDPERMKLLFSDRYYTEHFSSGAPPLPYLAYRRIRVSYSGEGRKQAIVVSLQRVLPRQDTENDQARDGYHGVQFSEDEFVFDTSWRFKSGRHWIWGVPGGRKRLKSPVNLLYGLYDRPRCWAARVKNRRVVVSYADGEKKVSSAYANEFPFVDLYPLLLPLAADKIAGKTIHWAGLRGERDAYQVKEGTIDGPGGKPRRALELIDVRTGWRAGHYFCPPAGEYGHSANQCWTAYRLSTKDVYLTALRGFVKEFRFSKPKDRKGKPVDLPLGLKEIR